MCSRGTPPVTSPLRKGRETGARIRPFQLRAGRISSVACFRGQGMSCRGFTLIEMIVAAIVLFIGVTAALMCMSAATQSTGVANEYQVAALLAQQRYGEIAANPTTELTGGSHSGAFGDNYPSYSWDATVDTTNVQDLVRLTLTISWRSGSVTRQAQFVTYEIVPSTSTSSPSGGA